MVLSVEMEGQRMGVETEAWSVHVCLLHPGGSMECLFAHQTPCWAALANQRAALQ